jgi:AraC family transcriptional activator of mtrCDE
VRSLLEDMGLPVHNQWKDEDGWHAATLAGLIRNEWLRNLHVPDPFRIENIELKIEPIVRVSETDLNSLMSSLEVNVVALSECLVSRGSRLEMAAASVTGLHYNLKGVGKMLVPGFPPIELKPHTLIILPANMPFRIEACGFPGKSMPSPDLKKFSTRSSGLVRRYTAGGGEPEVILICGFFSAFYGSSTDMFSSLREPIVEQFDETDRLDETLKLAISELIKQEVGSGAMSAAVLKQVIITILRRSLTSLNLWVERFAMLSDPQISRAFAEMAAHPGANHTVSSLAGMAGLSRSSFMARFTDVVGESPMTILRHLRMRQAAKQLASSQMPVDQIARSAGYGSRSSFIKAFRKSFECDPTEFRTQAKTNAFMKQPSSECLATTSEAEE